MDNLETLDLHPEPAVQLIYRTIADGVGVAFRGVRNGICAALAAPLVWNVPWLLNVLGLTGRSGQQGQVTALVPQFTSIAGWMLIAISIMCLTLAVYALSAVTQLVEVLSPEAPPSAVGNAQ